MASRNKITTIIGYDIPKSEMPGDADAKMVWMDQHMKSTHRRGHWNIASCEAIAAKMGIVDGLAIKHHN